MKKSVSRLVLKLMLLTLCTSPLAWSEEELSDQVAQKEALSPDDPQLQEAFAFEDNGDFASAIPIYHQLLKRYPGDDKVTNSIAGAYGSLGDFKSEIQWANKAIALNPKMMKAYINLGNGWFGLQSLEKAESAYQKAKQLAPKSPEPLYSLGLIAEQKGKNQDALAFYLAAIGADPNFESAYFNIAVLFANAKKYEVATEMLGKLLKINPNSTSAKEMLGQLKKEQTRN